MSRDAEPGRRHWNKAVPGDDPAANAVGEAIDAQLADLVDYCRRLTGRQTDAVSTAHSVMDSAHALLADRELLRAWLFALARRKALAAGPGSAQADSPRPREFLELVHRHGIRPQYLPVVLGIPAIEAEERLAAAEAEYDSRAAERAGNDSDRFNHNGWHDGTGSGDWAERDGGDERGKTTERGKTGERDDTDERDEPGERDDPDAGDDGRRPGDLDGLMRTPPGSAGRHAERTLGRGWRAMASGRAGLAAATAIVVAVIGAGAAYLAESPHGGPAGPAGLLSSHQPSPAPQTPTSTPSPTPTASPKHSPAPSRPVTFVQPPPAPTSAKPKPSPTDTTTSPPPTTPPPASTPPTPPPTPPVSSST